MSRRSAHRPRTVAQAARTGETAAAVAAVLVAAGPVVTALLGLVAVLVAR